MGTDRIALDHPVEWRSSDPNVVSVDQRGRVRALAPGSAYVSASAAGQCKSVLLDVSAGRAWRTCLYVAGLVAALAAVGWSATQSPDTPRDSRVGWATRPVAPIVADSSVLATASTPSMAGGVSLTDSLGEPASGTGAEPSVPAWAPGEVAPPPRLDDPSAPATRVGNGGSPPRDPGRPVARPSAVVSPSVDPGITTPTLGPNAAAAAPGAGGEGPSAPGGNGGSAPSSEKRLAIASLRSAEERSAAGDYDASLMFYLAADNRSSNLMDEFFSDPEVRTLREGFERSLEGTLRACNALRRSDSSRGAPAFDCTYPPGNGDV